MPERLTDVVIDSLLIEAEGNFPATHSDAQMVRLLAQALRQVRAERDAAREQAQARIAELEAHMSALAAELTELVVHAESSSGEPHSKSARFVLDHLDVTVQRHLARDRAAEAFFTDLEQHFRIYGYEKVHYIEQMLAAYRAAGKE